MTHGRVARQVDSMPATEQQYVCADTSTVCADAAFNLRRDPADSHLLRSQRAKYHAIVNAATAN